VVTAGVETFNAPTALGYAFGEGTTRPPFTVCAGVGVGVGVAEGVGVGIAEGVGVGIGVAEGVGVGVAVGFGAIGETATGLLHTSFLPDLMHV
jgi:hypothetical protein